MTQTYHTKALRRKQSKKLFASGFWLRWRALTTGERFVCANIILIPIWWTTGLYDYLPILLLLSVGLYEWRQHGKLNLTRPSWSVMAALAFGIYQLARVAIFYYEPRTIKFFSIVSVVFCPTIWLWYIQSKNIRLRIEPIAWACAVNVIQMLGFWFLLQFVLPSSIFPLPTIYGLITGTASSLAGSLSPFRTISGNIAGFCRCQLFFIFPSFFALFVGFLSLVSLEIKNRLWSWLLFVACVFLLLLSATRAVWVALPIVLGLRYLFSNYGRRWVPVLVFALIAVGSFLVFSLPVFTDLVLNQFTDLADTINNYRADSSSTRLEIYRQTWLGILENPLWGHLTTGPTINAYAQDYEIVGSHSVLLGNLLYLNGIVGTGLFLSFWFSLLYWLYKTRAGRPLLCFCLWFLYTFVAFTMDTAYGMSISSLPILVSIAIRNPQPKFVQGVRNA
ncbi:O-antigen ligase family protein [Gloeocapsa sp. BRSZ]